MSNFHKSGTFIKEFFYISFLKGRISNPDIDKSSDEFFYLYLFSETGSYKF